MNDITRHSLYNHASGCEAYETLASATLKLDQHHIHATRSYAPPRPSDFGTCPLDDFCPTTTGQRTLTQCHMSHASPNVDSSHHGLCMLLPLYLLRYALDSCWIALIMTILPYPRIHSTVSINSAEISASRQTKAEVSSEIESMQAECNRFPQLQACKQQGQI